MSSSGRPLTGFARPGTGAARPGTTSSNKPGTALSAALKAARPGTSSTRPLTTSGRCVAQMYCKCRSSTWEYLCLLVHL